MCVWQQKSNHYIFDAAMALVELMSRHVEYTNLGTFEFLWKYFCIILFVKYALFSSIK